MHARGSTISEIARSLNVDRKTVYRYINQQDFSPKLPKARPIRSKLDPYRHMIESWLEEDKHCFHKQRHTIRRICERLADECDFVCPHNTVSDYVRKNIRKAKKERASLDLLWQPGSAQADFGEVDCDIYDKRVRAHFQVLCFPNSNIGFPQLFLGETGECFCQGLQDIFEYIGGVPPIIVFDNAQGIGRLKLGRFIESELFSSFKAHYRFETRFCSPSSGWEKGSVERKVAFLRTELFVPVPKLENIIDFNASLLERCQFQQAEHHYTKKRTQGELFDEDLKRLIPLPSKRFKVVRYDRVTSDGYGHITIDNCHVYSSLPEYARCELIVAAGAHDVTILDQSGEVIAHHVRSFGSKRTESIDATSQLRLLTRRPNGWKNSRIRTEIPLSVVSHLDSLDTENLKRDLKLLYEASERSGLEATLSALDILAKEHEDFPDFFQVGVLAARIAGFGLDKAPEGVADLGRYDEMFLGGVKDEQ
jgi:transposase